MPKAATKKTTHGKKAAGKKKDPNAPKRPIGAYFRYCADARPVGTLCIITLRSPYNFKIQLFCHIFAACANGGVFMGTSKL